LPGLEHVHNITARFLDDGQRIIVNGNEAGRRVRCYLVELAGGKLRPITPEGTTGVMVSPDGQYVMGYENDRSVVIYPLDGGPPRRIPGLEIGFVPSQWSQDGSALYGYAYGELPSKVYKVDIANGKKTVIQQLKPGVPAGVVAVVPVVVSRDGTRFAYSYYQVDSVLYLFSGLK
jgi:hypothetical protein